MKLTSFAKTIILFVILSTSIDTVALQNKRSKEPIKIHAIDHQSLISKADLIYGKPVKLSEGYQATTAERLGRSSEALQNALCQSIPPGPGDEGHCQEVKLSHPEAKYGVGEWMTETYGNYRAVVLFTEDRENSIVMKHDLPLRWIKKGNSIQYAGKAHPGEYYTFQIGFYVLKDVENIEVSFRGNKISKDHFTCFNTGGTDWKGNKIEY